MDQSPTTRNPRKWRYRRSGEGLAIGVGIGIGIALGAAFNNLAVGIAVGAGIGVAIDEILARRNRSE